MDHPLHAVPPSPSSHGDGEDRCRGVPVPPGHRSEGRRVDSEPGVKAALFLYGDVPGRQLTWLDEVVRAKKPRRHPGVLTSQEAQNVLMYLHGEKWIATMLIAADVSRSCISLHHRRQARATQRNLRGRCRRKMPECPHCRQVIGGKDLRNQFSFKPYRPCPSCARPFTVDASTKYRQAIGLVIALISLVLTLGLFFRGTDWLTPAIISYIILVLFLHWGNKHVVFVPYEKG